jgi:hypothetical protein
MGDTLKEMAELVKGFVGDSGVCSDERAYKAINQARRLLWNKRSWTTQEEYVQICCVNDCFTLPNRYEQIKLAWIGDRPASLADEWFNATDALALNESQSCHRLITEVGGKPIFFRDYTTHPYRLGVMLESAEDVGVTLTFEVQDQYDTYHTIKVTGTNPPDLAQFDLLIKGARSVSKPATKGRVRIYAYDTAIEAKTLISVYQPNDINPSFRRFKAPRTCECITLYASKRYFDLVDDQELVEFTPDAMIYAILALNSRDNRKAQEFLVNLDLAIKEQEKEMEGEEIPTAAPLRIANFQRPENLIGNYLGSPSADDYFFQPSWP